MSLYTFRPEQVHHSAWIAPNAIVVGDVILQAHSSIWFGAVLRGDTAQLVIGAQTNIQDLTMIHADEGLPTIIGERVTVGHRAIIHSATIESNVLIGMGAIVLNGAVIRENSIVGAGALVTEGKKFPPNSLILGSPARVVRELTDDDLAKIRQGHTRYVEKAREYRKVWE